MLSAKAFLHQTCTIRLERCCLYSAHGGGHIIGGNDVISVENCSRLVSADPHGHSLWYTSVHEVANCRAAQVVNDEPFIFIPWEAFLVFRLNLGALSEPNSIAGFLPFNPEVCVIEHAPLIRLHLVEYFHEHSRERDNASLFRLRLLFFEPDETRVEIHLRPFNLARFIDAHAAMIKEADKRPQVRGKQRRRKRA